VKEVTVEEALRDMCTLLGWLLIKLNPLGLVGIPDRILLMPGGRIVFVELKTLDGGRVKRKQARWHARLRKMGFRVEVVWTVDQAGHLVDALA
jgi:G:T-mismatch repair DNA endonuclease (very short patch repair protein)